jgi:ATPase subunit of ABC transporter with duplicated ATPase domains
MSLIRLNNIFKSYDSTPVLREIYFKLENGERVGLIGKNGAGKTTVLKLILGQETPTSGAIEMDSGLKIGYFSQFSELNSEVSVRQILEDVFAHIREIENNLLEVEQSLEARPSGDDLDRILLRQAELLEAMDRCDGWDYTYRIETALSRLGFNEEYRSYPIDQLSGGWRNRAALAKILLEEPDVLLMDEPTNFLDVQGLSWLEEWFRQFRGALMVVSHDRHFLDRVATRIVEIENYHFYEYQGNYTQYIREKPMRMKSIERQFEHEEALLVYEAEAIADRIEAEKNPSRALKRRLANIKKQAQPRPMDRIITNIYQRLYVPNQILQAEALSKSYPDQRLFDALSFEIQRGDRFVVLGPNGCGKTTLLKVLCEEVPPDAGRVTWGKGVGYAYYNQIFEELDLNDTVTHAVNITGLAYLAPRKQVDRFLSLMQFSEMDLSQRIGTLSGGQRARVALAKALLSGAALIILDEPTNHLDMTTTQVMERALKHFPGAVLVVSHDRFFIDKVATRLLVFEGPGTVREVSGNWTIWRASLENN